MRFVALVGTVMLLGVGGCTTLEGLGAYRLGDGGVGGDGSGIDATTGDDGPHGGDARLRDHTGDAPAADGPASCGPADCVGGCCDAKGQCVPFAAQSGMQCGAGGAACASCVAGEACASGACSCGGAACAGCCTGGDTCEVLASESSSSCGAGGTACASGQVCDGSGQCVCNPASCPNGCCNGATCEPYASESSASCGTGGASCAACASGQECNGSGACVCDAASCPSGCCNSGACVPYSSESATLCGTGGADCSACGTGYSCTSGACTCASDGFAASRTACIDEINKLRATQGLAPYTLVDTPCDDLCVDDQATYDESVGSAHYAWLNGLYPSCNGNAQDECEGYGTSPAAIVACLDDMWNEQTYPNCTGCVGCTAFGGACPGCDFYGTMGPECGHYVNMSAVYFTMAWCGFALSSGSWATQNFE